MSISNLMVSLPRIFHKAQLWTGENIDGSHLLSLWAARPGTKILAEPEQIMLGSGLEIEPNNQAE